MKLIKCLTQEQEESILELFYRTELRGKEVIIDNRDKTISKELKIQQSRVSNCISKNLREKIKELNNNT